MRLFYWLLHKTCGEGDSLQSSLCRAGLEEKALRRMDPDDRVAALEKAGLDPYDYIYLAY